MKNVFYIIVLIIPLFFIACGGGNKENSLSDKDVIPVKVIPLEKKDSRKIISVAGKFTTDDETFLSFKTGGIVSKIFVNDGDAIRKGQLLATLDLDEIEAMVQQAKAGYEKAERDYNRVSNLYKDSVTTLEQLQNTKTALEVAENQLSIAKFNRSYSEIRAIENGFVLKRFVNEGQLVAGGKPIFQTNGAGKGNWFLKVGVSDLEWASIDLNNKAEVKIDAYPGEKFSAFVFRKSEGVDPYTGTLSVDLKLTSAVSGKVTSGLFGRADIVLKKRSTAWMIPFEAILDGDGNNGYVFITNDSSTARKYKVSITGFDKSNVFVDAGLENALYLIVSGSAYLTDNSKIKIVE